jgi:hypothetical protein
MSLSAGARTAVADCCRIVKTDVETPPATLRVCQPTESGECGAVLYVGTLAQDESALVCSDTPTIRYAEFDDVAADFGPSVEAVCIGDVEI